MKRKRERERKRHRWSSYAIIYNNISNIIIWPDSRAETWRHRFWCKSKSTIILVSWAMGWTEQLFSLLLFLYNLYSSHLIYTMLDLTKVIYLYILQCLLKVKFNLSIRSTLVKLHVPNSYFTDVLSVCH